MAQVHKGSTIPAAAPGRFRIRSVFYFALALLFVLAILTYTPGDNDILSGGVEAMPANWVGRLGARIAQALFLSFGLAAYLFAALVCFGALRALLHFEGGTVRPLRRFGTVVLSHHCKRHGCQSDCCEKFEYLIHKSLINNSDLLDVNNGKRFKRYV